ncbi:hypothetical protein DID74_01300 [Candidatus Marinamargulisbacteria bacterium SCGC AG-333-B06]|nr:hypothetical protein DID74_01300 [Candidatus Marinamargulisbacteria bacterium SCGC AG-333-B06]
MILADLNREAIQLLAVIYPDSAEFEIECLLKFYFKFSSSDFVTYLRMTISNDQYHDCLNLVRRRMAHEPLDYILGSSQFMGRDYTIIPGVLIPRPETELLVQEAQCLIPHYFSSSFLGLECGFGSGVISIELALSFLESSWLSFDVSREALQCATTNSRRYQVESIQWHHQNFFSSKLLWQELEEPLFLIANPPYIPTNDLNSLEKSVKQYEPLIALDGGEFGLAMYHAIFSLCQNHIFVICLECGINQADFIIDLAADFGFQCVNKVLDYHQITRVLSFTNQT